MASRMRSPNYPGTPLSEAIEIVSKIFKVERTNPIDREVAAKAAGYTGISGRSAKVLADLSQYGLLERTGKSGVRVSRRAVEILHPDDDETRGEALRAAAFEPELFQRIGVRFPDGKPSENALRSYFLKEGFTDSAIQPAMRGYFQTIEFLEQSNVSESRGRPGHDERKSEPVQLDAGDAPMNAFRAQSGPVAPPPAAHTPNMASETMNLDWQNRRVVLSRVVKSQAEANDVIDFIKAMVQFLPEGTPEPATSEPMAANDEDEGSHLI